MSGIDPLAGLTQGRMEIVDAPAEPVVSITIVASFDA